MRTTVNVDDDVLQAAKSLAAAQRVSLGRALSDLARRGLAVRTTIHRRNGFPVFDVPPNSGPITLEMVKRAEDSE